MRKLFELIPELQVSDYSRLCRRFKDLKLEISESDEKVGTAVDASGVKVTGRGEWLRKYHKGKRRGWIKSHVAVDAESKELLSIEVTDEKTGDSKVFEDLVEDLDLKIVWRTEPTIRKKFSNSWRKEEVDPPLGIKLRKDANMGLSSRGKAAKEFHDLGYEEWKKKHDYGKRWSVEGFFSEVKRCFGKTVRAASPEGMIREVERKFALYNLVTSV